MLSLEKRPLHYRLPSAAISSLLLAAGGAKPVPLPVHFPPLPRSPHRLHVTRLIALHTAGAPDPLVFVLMLFMKGLYSVLRVRALEGEVLKIC